MLALLPMILALAPQLVTWIAGDTAGTLASRAAQVVADIAGSDDPGLVSKALMDPTKATEARLALARLVTEAETARRASDLAQLQATLGGVADARARDVALGTSSGKRNVRADVMVALTIFGIGGGLTFLMVGAFTPGSSVEGAVLGLIGLLSGCFKDAFQFEFGSTRASGEKSEAAERVTTALVAKVETPRGL